MSRRRLHHKNFKNSHYSEFRRSIVWSAKLAWKTAPTLFSVIIACFVLESFIPASATALIGLVISKFKAATDNQFDIPMLYLGLVIFLFALELILVEVRTFCRLRLGDETAVSLHKILYQHTAIMDLSFFEQSNSLNKLFRATTGGGTGAFGPIQSTLATASGFIQVITLFGLMLYYQPWCAAILMLASIPLFALRSWSAVEKYKIYIKTSQRKRLSQYYTSRLSGSENVPATKIYGLGDEMIRRYEKVAKSVIQDKKKILGKISTVLGLGSSVYLIILASVIFYITHQFSVGIITTSVLVAFLLAAFRAIRSITQISKAMATGMDSALTIVPLLEFLREKPLITEVKGAYAPKTLQGNIVLKNVSFAYPGTNKNVINNLSLNINAGEKVAIVGGNGAGKSTLSKLIARLYDTTEGHIYIDGHELRDLSLNWLHQHLSMVFQKPTEYEANVRDNIAFGNWLQLKDNPKKVEQIAKQVGIYDFVSKLPNGFDTHLGRLFGEVTLSQGQWQLLAVARLLAKDHSILILDEPTSSLDTKAETAMFKAIRKYAEDRTVIFVSHKFSTVKEADRIIVLDQGQLVEDGTHEQLMNNSGFYAAMVNHQRSEVKI